ncbi:MAG TPA: cytochrome c-type biogenesis protein [Anaerolineae bacterium]|nr:cytochrome c-type biogenesis protein [Anaerolineae bacterium]
MMNRTVKAAVFVFWVVASLLLIALTSVALAQNGTPPAPTPAARPPVTADDVNRIAKQMYCPVCENEPLDACRTAACQQWRAQIGQMLSEGQTEQQIKDYFVARYGARVLAQPPAEGTSLWLYVLPIVGLIVGVIIVVWLLRRFRARGAEAPVSATPAKSSGDEYVDRVERDLKNF